MFATLAVAALALLAAVVATALADKRDRAILPAAPGGLRLTEFSAFRL
jgi:hypothetical protein